MKLSRKVIWNVSFIASVIAMFISARIDRTALIASAGLLCALLCLAMFWQLQAMGTGELQTRFKAAPITPDGSPLLWGLMKLSSYMAMIMFGGLTLLCIYGLFRAL